MMNTIWAIVREGRIVPLEKVEIPEGAKVLVTVLHKDATKDDAAFWSAVNQTAAHAVWDNTEDDVYAELLEK